jgi:hypothetical protein
VPYFRNAKNAEEDGLPPFDEVFEAVRKYGAKDEM